MKQLLRVSEAARCLNISRARCYELARKGHLLVVRLGSQIRFDPEQLESLLVNGGFSLAVPSAEGRTCTIPEGHNLQTSRHAGLATRHT